MFWPTELSEREAKISVLPILLETQERFINILKVDVPNLDSLFQVIQASELSANIFLKHLAVLADFGGEMFKQVNGEFARLFPTNTLEYFWNSQRHTYHFLKLPISGKLTNDRLGISGERLLEDQPLSELHQDAIAMLLLGSTCVDEEVAETLVKCEIGTFLGRPDELEAFIRQRYIWVSRIITGAKSNTLGQIAQDFVKEHLEANLMLEGIEIKKSGHLPNVTHTDSKTGRLTSFDLTISDGKKYVAIEVSFQVTTNSTIERKSGQARSRFEQVERAGHKIAYVIDGAGNFQRTAMFSTICSYSDCTVAFSRSELDVLCEFLREYFGAA